MILTPPDSKATKVYLKDTPAGQSYRKVYVHGCTLLSLLRWSIAEKPFLFLTVSTMLRVTLPCDRTPPCTCTCVFVMYNIPI